MDPPIWSVPRLWDGERVFILGGGPSLKGFGAECLRGKGRVLVVNTSYKLVPFADALYFADKRWFDWEEPGVRRWTALKVTINADAWRRDDALKLIRSGKMGGLSEDPTTVNLGNNSGFQAINLAFHLGAGRIVLLGFDMRWHGSGPSIVTHWHGGHPRSQVATVFTRMIPAFDTIRKPLERHGVEVVNATPDSALKTWPMVQLADELM